MLPIWSRWAGRQAWAQEGGETQGGSGLKGHDAREDSSATSCWLSLPKSLLNNSCKRYFKSYVRNSCLCSSGQDIQCQPHLHHLRRSEAPEHQAANSHLGQAPSSITPSHQPQKPHRVPQNTHRASTSHLNKSYSKQCHCQPSSTSHA